MPGLQALRVERLDELDALTAEEDPYRRLGGVRHGEKRLADVRGVVIEPAAGAEGGLLDLPVFR